ncbi:hypothetical protein DPMN_012486 [Dreissena polymorpha]|uniref:Uncharacterized protein n=1 Tax=Dreissena polymorpha TaxID=45954 RepID=A0A9D4S1E7_DREPO|nr:hypothetical protein DPMN_012486 [Dreissena polymorpha]
MAVKDSTRVCPMFQILPNLTGKMGARVKELQKKLAEREESRQPAAVLGKQDMAALSTKMSAKVQGPVVGTNVWHI